MSGKPIAELLDDNRLVIWSIEQSREIYNNGFYGKPLGTPRPDENFNAPLLLDPVEALYLNEKKLIRIIRNGKKVSSKKLESIQIKSFSGFSDKYRVYKELRNRGYVATPGIKYGSDFAVYENGPGRDHAPYVVQILSEKDHLSAAEIVKAGRLASTVRKAFIIAVVNENQIRFVEFNWWRA